MTPTLQNIITQLDLEPHPEGGWYKRTYTAAEVYNDTPTSTRPLGSAIYYLVPGDVTTLWHRLDADEVWHFYTGDSLLLETRAEMDQPSTSQILSTDFKPGTAPQHLIRKGLWQRCRLVTPNPNHFALIGCSVTPAFSFDGFELYKSDMAQP